MTKRSVGMTEGSIETTRRGEGMTEEGGICIKYFK
jgi:hypothetical protein